MKKSANALYTPGYKKRPQAAFVPSAVLCLDSILNKGCPRRIAPVT